MPRARSLHCGPTAARLAEATAKRVGPSVEMTKEPVWFHTEVSPYSMISVLPRAIVHIDCDAFFASCEQAMHPEYRGRPVVTGAERGIVAAASYEAKKFGVQRGVALWDVKKLCPNAIILPSDYESYSIFSQRMFAIIRRFTEDVEEYSIDEAFCELTIPIRNQVTKESNLVTMIAHQIKHTIQRELGITVSVGLSTTKVLAKLGSKFQKPDGFTVITAETRESYLAQTPLQNIWGIGPATAQRAGQLGITTALDFSRRDKTFIQSHFAKPYQEIYYELNGVSVYPINTAPKTDYQSISKTRTFTPPSTDQNFVYAQLLKNLENACIKARRYNLAATGLVVYLKRQDFSTRALETALPSASCYPQDMTSLVRALFNKLFHPRIPYRATGVVLTELLPQDRTQLSLFEPQKQLAKLQQLYSAVDRLAQKHGKHIVHLASSQSAHRITNYRELQNQNFLFPERSQRDKKSQNSTLRQAQGILLSRTTLPWRKTNRLSGESARKHLPIPLLTGRV